MFRVHGLRLWGLGLRVKDRRSPGLLDSGVLCAALFGTGQAFRA